eukprot:6450416-Amphidinium_carterae.1
MLAVLGGARFLVTLIIYTAKSSTIAKRKLLGRSGSHNRALVRSRPRSSPFSWHQSVAVLLHSHGDTSATD